MSHEDFCAFFFFFLFTLLASHWDRFLEDGLFVKRYRQIILLSSPHRGQAISILHLPWICCCGFNPHLPQGGNLSCPHVKDCKEVKLTHPLLEACHSRGLLQDSIVFLLCFLSSHPSLIHKRTWQPGPNKTVLSRR